jgi:Ca2+-binding EF-hand superfamily protein
VNQSTLNKVTSTELKNLLQLIDIKDGKLNYTQFLASTISQQALEAK